MCHVLAALVGQGGLSVRTREEQKKRDAAKCRHYAGCQGRTCKAGCDFLSWNGGKETGFIQMLPCFGGENIVTQKPNGSTCEKYAPFTTEEIEAKEREFTEAMTYIRDARNEIVQRVKDTGERSGHVKCPKCSGDLRYSRASNGHVHAMCNTPGCLSWME